MTAEVDTPPDLTLEALLGQAGSPLLLVVLDAAGDAVDLKSHLLDSRAMDNYPVYARNNARFSTAREETLLDMMVGVARGLDHLAKARILHGRVCAR